MAGIKRVVDGDQRDNGRVDGKKSHGLWNRFVMSEVRKRSVFGVASVEIGDRGRKGGGRVLKRRRTRWWLPKISLQDGWLAVPVKKLETPKRLVIARCSTVAHQVPCALVPFSTIHEHDIAEYDHAKILKSLWLLFSLKDCCEMEPISERCL